MDSFPFFVFSIFVKIAILSQDAHLIGSKKTRLSIVGNLNKKAITPWDRKSFVRLASLFSSQPYLSWLLSGHSPTFNYERFLFGISKFDLVMNVIWYIFIYFLIPIFKNYECYPYIRVFKIFFLFS